MQRPVLRLIAGRPIPVLRHEIRTESLGAIVKRKLYAFAETVVAAIALLSVAWALSVLLLSLELVRR